MCQFIKEPIDESGIKPVAIKVYDRVTAVVYLSRKELAQLDKLAEPSPGVRRYNRISRMDTKKISIPTRKQVRPSSAAANIQSHDSYKSGLFDNRGPASTAPVERPKTGVPKAHHWRGGSETADLEKIKLQRRPTLSTLEGLEETDVPRTGTTNASAGDLLKSKVKFVSGSYPWAAKLL